MVKKMVVADTTVKFKGFFHFKMFYKLLHDWLWDEGFRDFKGGDQYFETLHLQKETAVGKEIIIKWSCQNDLYKSNYYRQQIDIEYHCLELKPAEAMYKGKKITINHGEVELQIKGILLVDYANKIEEHPILGTFEKFLREKVLNKQLENLERDFYRDVMRLQGTMKAYVHMKTFSQAVETLEKPRW